MNRVDWGKKNIWPNFRLLFLCYEITVEFPRAPPSIRGDVMGLGLSYSLAKGYEQSEIKKIILKTDCSLLLSLSLKNRKT